MRKSISVFLALLMVLTLALAGCKPELTLTDATSKITAYFEVFYYGDLYMLESLGLMTTNQAESLHDQPTEQLPNGEEYWETGVLFSDFENACLRYMSKNFFDQLSWADISSDWCCLGILDDQLIYYAMRGHGGDAYEGLRNVTYLKTSGLQRWYSVTADFVSEGDVIPYCINYEIAFILENGNYVIDAVKEGGKVDDTQPKGFDITPFANTIWHAGEIEMDIKNMGTRGVIFNITQYRICSADEIETSGNFQYSEEGTTDTFDWSQDGMSIKGSLTFSLSGDSIILSIEASSGFPFNSFPTGTYTLEKGPIFFEDENPG